MVFTVVVQPRFGETDMLGHVNNTVIAAWFELASNPIIEIFQPGPILRREDFPLIMVHTDFDFVRQVYFRREVEIRTWITRVGEKSVTAYHEAWQDGELKVKGGAVMVHYDFEAASTVPIPEDKRRLLEEHAPSA